jgi:hypothetical protein
MKPSTTPQDQDPRMVRVLYEGKEKFISEKLANDPSFIRENNIRIMPKSEPVQSYVATKEVPKIEAYSDVANEDQEETPQQNKGGRPRKN